MRRASFQKRVEKKTLCMSLVKWENLVVARGKKQLTQPFDGAIHPREKWWVSGASGTGKSTFLDLLAGRIFPSQGKITLKPGIAVQLVERDYRFDRLVRQSFLYYQQRYQSQDAERAPKLWEVIQGQVKPLDTVDEASVDLPPARFTPEVFQAGCDLFRLHDLLQLPVVSLSNGETRRALLAMSWMKKPDLLLLDQPFIGLDVASRTQLQSILSTLDQAVVLIANSDDVPDGFDQELRFDSGGVWVNPNFPIPTPPKPTPVNFTDWPESLISVQTVFRATQVQVNYGDKIILNNVNWQVNTGETWALLGANGSGKSTLLALLTGDHPQAYKNNLELFEKRRGSGESIWDIKKQIGLVSPEIHLFVDKSCPVWKTIGSGFFDATGLYRSISTEQRSRISQVAAWVGLSEHENTRLQDLSQSEQRRALLARALVKNPPVLILDEPCQGLDHHQMIAFRDLVSDLTVQLHKTLIYVSHYAEEIPACIKNECVLSEGQVSYAGPRRI